MGPKKVSKKDSSRSRSGQGRTSKAEVEEDVEDRAFGENEVADYNGLNLIQLRNIMRERGMASPKSKTRL